MHGRSRALIALTLLTLASALPSACGGSGKPATTSATAARSSATSTSSLTTSSSSSSSTAAPQPSAGATSTSATITGSVSAPGLIAASTGEVRATLHATSHSPRVNAPWPISFTVSRGGRPLKAHLSYEYLLAGNVVAKRSSYTFTGHFSDLFRWPPSAVGYPLTFRAVIVAGGQTLYLDYPVQVLR